MNELRIGSRIRLRVRTLSGWRGTGRVTAIDGNTITFTKDGVPDSPPLDVGFCNKEEADVVCELLAGDRIRIPANRRTGGPLYGKLLEDVRNGVVVYRGNNDSSDIIRRASRDEVVPMRGN